MNRVPDRFDSDPGLLDWYRGRIGELEALVAKLTEERAELRDVLEGLLLVSAPGMTTLLDVAKDRAREILGGGK